MITVLRPQDIVPQRPKRKGDIAVLVINRDRTDLTRTLIRHYTEFLSTDLTVDLYLIDMGSQDPLPMATFHYEDEPYSGKPYGHNVALLLAKQAGDYHFYYVTMNDVLPVQWHALDTMVDMMLQHPDLGLLAPTGDFKYLQARPQENTPGFHYVSSTDYLAFMMRAEAAHTAFVNPDFRFSWGCELEMCWKLHKAGWRVSYCDHVQHDHWGTSTWGKVPGLPPRQEYIYHAKRFMVPYYNEKYGQWWDIEWSDDLSHDILYNSFKLQRVSLQGLGGDSPRPVTLNLYCGDTYDRKAINLDVVRRGYRVDGIYPHMYDLPFFKRHSVKTITVNQRPNHYHKAMAYWQSILKPGGEIIEKY